MARQKIFYECDFCQRLYDEEVDATECERHHAEMDHLKVIDCANVNIDSNDFFPEKILLQNDQDNGHLAEYILSKQGSISDFYRSEEQSQWCHV